MLDKTNNIYFIKINNKKISYKRFTFILNTSYMVIVYTIFGGKIFSQFSRTIICTRHI